MSNHPLSQNLQNAELHNEDLTSQGLSSHHEPFFVDDTQPKNRNLFVWGVVLLTIFGIITSVISTIFYRDFTKLFEEEVLIPPSKDLEAVKLDQQTWLHTYGFIDKNKQIIHIPIDIAMSQEVEAKKRSLP